MPPLAFFNKQYVPLSEAKVPITTHALHYGTACFEGIRGNWNSEEQETYLFRVADHYRRLLGSCRILKIEIPFSVEELCDITAKLVQMSGYKEDVYIRPVAFKSAGVIGVRLHNVEDDFFVFVTTFPAYLDVDKGIRCCTSSWRRVDDSMIPSRAKITGTYVNSALAKTEAIEDGYDEAILLTHDGHVSEGSGENLFLVSRGKLVTPPPSDNVLLGITRDTVIQLAQKELGIETQERSVDRSELFVADECFLTGTAAHISPVTVVDNRKVGDGQIGKITAELQRIYFQVLQGRVARYKDWCLPVYRVPMKAKTKA